MAELPPQETVVETPSIELTTKYGRLDLHWLNARLVMTDYPLTNNHLEYTASDNQELPIMLTEKEWEMLMALEFPWVYVPDASRDTDEDRIAINYGKYNMLLHRHNTTLRLFKNSSRNHAEHTPVDGKNIRMAINDDLWKRLFLADFAVKWQPLVDHPTEEWFQGGRMISGK